MFLILTVIESVLSLYWLINSSYFFFRHKGSEMDSFKCNKCKMIALFGIFIYCFDWTLLTTIIFHLKQVISNPISAIFNPKKKIITYLIFCLSISCLAVVFAYFGNYYGINVCIIYN